MLIGIEDYPPGGHSPPGFDENDLPGIHNDIRRMREMLVSRGFPSENITVVQDLDATRDRIEGELNVLARKAKASDTVVFYYSGHGTQVPDLSGDEDDGWDEAIVPAEPLAGNVDTEDDLQKLLIDDRIADLLGRFSTKNLTVIFDSCFSGTADRKNQPSPPAGFGVTKLRKFTFSNGLLLKAEAAHTDRMEAKATEDLGGAHTFISAARPWETSGCANEGSYFTSALVTELSAHRFESWDQLLVRVRRQVLSIIPTQSPGVESGGRYLPFSLDEVPAVQPFIRSSVAIEDTTADGTVLLGAYQSLFTEQKGALYRVYAHDDTDFKRRPIARIRINGGGVDDQTTADIVSGSVSGGDRAIASVIPIIPTRPKVLITGEMQDGGQEKELSNSISELSKFLARGNALQVYKRRVAGSVKLDYEVEITSKASMYSCNVWSNGAGLISTYSAQNLQGIASEIRRLLLARHKEFTRLVRLHNLSSAFELITKIDLFDRASENVTVLSGRDAWITVFGTTEKGPTQFIASSDRIVAAGVPFKFSIVNEHSNQRQILKILATRMPLNTLQIRSASPGTKVDVLYRLMKNTLGVGRAQYLTTEGWADDTIWVEP